MFGISQAGITLCIYRCDRRTRSVAGRVAIKDDGGQKDAGPG